MSYLPPPSLCHAVIISFHFTRQKVEKSDSSEGKGSFRAERKQIKFFSDFHPVLFFWKGAGCSLSAGTSPPSPLLGLISQSKTMISQSKTKHNLQQTKHFSRCETDPVYGFNKTTNTSGAETNLEGEAIITILNLKLLCVIPKCDIQFPFGTEKNSFC